MAGSHEEIIKELAKELKPIFDKSQDGVYVWLDDENMVCNEKLAKMFGYKSASEMSSKSPFLDTFVAKEDQDMFSDNYQRSISSLSNPVTFRFRAVRKDGSKFLAETDMIPIAWKGHEIAYHFVRELK